MLLAMFDGAEKLWNPSIFVIVGRKIESG